MTVLEYEPINQFPDNTQQKYGYCNGINSMHYFKIKAGGPVRIFFSEEIHIQI